MQSKWILFAFVQTACAGAPNEPPAEEIPCQPTLQSLRDTVFRRSCARAGCHDAAFAGGGLDLTRTDLEAQVIAVASSNCAGWLRVKPGDPEGSYLWNKVASAEPACGERMPVGTELSPADQACIREWIASLDAESCEKCGGAECVSLTTDPLHCGSCETTCPPGAPCENGACTCPSGLAACGVACTDLATDASNCGSCGSSCGPGGRCEAGSCRCSAGLLPCAGTCVDVQSAADHCGACGAACPSGTVCLNGQCAAGCGALTQCGSSCVDSSSNVAHCGACDAACSAGLDCIDSACACPGGGALCGGVCTDTRSSTSHCGACGNSCAPGETCSDGRCACASSSALSFSADIAPIFVASCAGTGCHSGRRPQAELSLEAGAAYAELVGAPSQCQGRVLVTPGKPSASYLMNKLTGVGLCGGTQMPKKGESLPAQQLEAISAWICSGAPNN
jgi:hypothetical protein